MATEQYEAFRPSEEPKCHWCGVPMGDEGEHTMREFFIGCYTHVSTCEKAPHEVKRVYQLALIKAKKS